MVDDDSGRTGPVTLHGSRDEAHTNWRLSMRALSDVSASSGLILPPNTHTHTFSVIIHSKRRSVRMNETVSALMTGAVMAPVCHGEGLTDVVGWIWVIPMIIICLVEGRERDDKEKNRAEREKRPSGSLCPTAGQTTAHITLHHDHFRFHLSYWDTNTFE